MVMVVMIVGVLGKGRHTTYYVKQHWKLSLTQFQHTDYICHLASGKQRNHRIKAVHVHYISLVMHKY